MRREEKAQGSKDRIMDAAMREFGTKNYDASSLNNICNDNAISKGLIYHYFGNKDDLYLRCVEASLEKFTNFLAEEVYDFFDFQQGMNQYMERRLLFFRTNPREAYIFFYTVLQAPKHLAHRIQELRTVFDGQCIGYYKEAISHITLREGVTEKNALEYFVMLQELFNGYFQKCMGDDLDLNGLLQVHESQLSKILNMMLYGIAKEKIG